MANRDRLAAEILVTVEVSAEEKQAIVEAFRALDVAARPYHATLLSLLTR